MNKKLKTVHKSVENLEDSKFFEKELEWKDFTYRGVSCCLYSSKKDSNGEVRFFKFENKRHHLPLTKLVTKLGSSFKILLNINSASSESMKIFLGTFGAERESESYILKNKECLKLSYAEPFDWICIDPLLEGQAFIALQEIFQEFKCEFPKVKNISDLKESFVETSMIEISDFFEAIPEIPINFEQDINAVIHWYSKSVLVEPYWYSDSFLRKLKEFTGLNLELPEERPQWKQFSHKSYIILTDEHPESEGLDLIYTLQVETLSIKLPSCSLANYDIVNRAIELNNEIGGDWIYLCDDGEEIARISPIPNTLALVYRKKGSGVRRFKEYQHLGQSSIQMIITFPVS